VAALVALAVTLASPALAARAPALQVMDDRPLVLHGTRFRPGEAVRVTVRMGAHTWARQTEAGSRGGFTLKFPRLRLNYCATPLRIVAHGRASGDVVAKLPVRECAIP
jgi:hypothetical protein